MGGTAAVRLRSVAGDYFVPILVVCLLLAAVGGYATATAYADESTRTETRQVASWESTGSFDHRATVVNDTAVYDAGEVLRNRTTYFTQLTPTLDGSFAYTYAASDGGELGADASAVLVYRSASEGEEGESTVYWRSESVLTAERADSLEPGERLRVPFSVNVSRATGRLAAIDEQFGGTPGQKELFVEVRVEVSGTRNGVPVDTTRTYRLPVSASGSVYEVNDPGAVTNSGGQRQQVSVAVSPGPLRAVGGPLAALLGLVGLASLAGGRHAGVLTLSEREREWLRYRNDREEFDEWVTAAVPPARTYDRETIDVESLEGLVDVAIDTDRRVLEDRKRDTFVVLGGDYTYVYRPPPEPDADDREPLSETGSVAGGLSTRVFGDDGTEDGDDGAEDAADTDADENAGHDEDEDEAGLADSDPDEDD